MEINKKMLAHNIKVANYCIEDKAKDYNYLISKIVNYKS